MTKFMNNLYKYSAWIIVGLSLVGYMAYKSMTFGGTIQGALTDWQSYVNMLFVIWLNVNMVDAAWSTGTTNGINSEEFSLADDVNNKLIQNVNNEMRDFRDYVKKLNEHELITLQEDYLFKVGDKKIEELTPEERKEYDELKPIRHNIYGFNLPLYYELAKSGEINYRASERQNEGKHRAQIKKIFNGILFGALTTNMLFQVNNVGNAFLSLLIISVGLIITFVMIYVKRIFKFKYSIPRKVIQKHNLYKSYEAYKNGTHKLMTFDKKENGNEKNIVDNNDNADIDSDKLPKDNNAIDRPDL